MLSRPSTDGSPARCAELWLFPGLHPGRPVLPATISHRLARIGIDTFTARTGALLQLTSELPRNVTTDLLGIRPKIAVAWSQLTGRPWATYPALHDNLAASPQVAGRA